MMQAAIYKSGFWQIAFSWMVFSGWQALVTISLTSRIFLTHRVPARWRLKSGNKTPLGEPTMTVTGSVKSKAAPLNRGRLFIFMSASFVSCCRSLPIGSPEFFKIEAALSCPKYTHSRPEKEHAQCHKD
ncbi:MAG TPA: hypothetical protein VGI03_03360 [Verrucomicrobiae bacterium]